MPTFAESLKKEVARLARKELKGDVSVLRRTTTAQRSEIAALKRELKSLHAQVRGISTELRKVNGAVSTKTVSPAAKSGRKPQYSAEGFAALRQKFGVTQAQMGTLLGASSLSVYKWESGQVVPREKQREKIAALRRLGKRAVVKILAE